MKRRNTPTKQAVLALITESGSALSQDAIEERITVKINRATIYRILNQFCEDGILCRIITGNGKQYFALRDKKEDQVINDFHFHFRCLKCQQVECLPSTINFPAPKGYVLKDANCVLSGICKVCAEQ
jgi:Fur family ferric uptake transcriptional regulator